VTKSFRAKKPFLAKHPAALAVYCSDGRFTEAVEELLHSLGHDRLDTLTMPGGAALLETTTATFSALEACRAATSFLVRGHSIEHVVLLAHEGCGFYRDRMRYDSPEAIVQRQHADLRAARDWILRTHGGVSIDLYYASVVDDRVAFSRVDDA